MTLEGKEMSMEFVVSNMMMFEVVVVVVRTKEKERREGVVEFESMEGTEKREAEAVERTRMMVEFVDIAVVVVVVVVVVEGDRIVGMSDQWSKPSRMRVLTYFGFEIVLSFVLTVVDMQIGLLGS